MDTIYGIKIVMNEDKIINEHNYSLDDIYSKIDKMAELSRMEKVDKFNYISKNDTPSDLGCFVWSYLNEADWFMGNVKEWLWLDKVEGTQDIIKYLNEKDRKYAKPKKGRK